MTQEEMAKAYADGYNKEYQQIAYDAFLCGYGAKCDSAIQGGLKEAAAEYDFKQFCNRCEGKKWTTSREDFIVGAEWQKAKMSWHSVDESLPEMDEEVIVLADKIAMYKIDFGHIVDKTRCVDYNGWNIPGVKFWMPMPKIPEE